MSHSTLPHQIYLYLSDDRSIYPRSSTPTTYFEDRETVAQVVSVDTVVGELGIKPRYFGTQGKMTH